MFSQPHRRVATKVAKAEDVTNSEARNETFRILFAKLRLSSGSA